MTVGVRLDEAAWGLLHQAIELYQDNPRAVAELRHQVARLEQPLRIAVVGPWRSGKSTVLNALMGEEVAPVERADGAFTWYEDGEAPRAIAYPVGQPPQELAVVKSATGLRVDLGWGTGEVRDIVVRWPTRALRQITLIDTPAVSSGAEQDRSPVLERVLRDSDAVLYLTRDCRDSDLRVLESARDSAVGQSAPVNVIMVLSRADETGGGRIDGLLTARQLARRHHRDPRVNALSVNVVACSAMIGLAGRMLGESDFAALATVAQVPRAELDVHLISADRFL
ncbi:dynamin family protein, partial [Micromonospora sp. M51]